MGLDGVELIMAYEEAFDVRFTDEDAVGMATPGDVIEFVASRVPLTADAACLEQRAFHIIRAELVELSSVERRHLRPLTPLAHVLPLMPPETIATRVRKRLSLKRAIPLDRLWTVGDLSAWLAENATERLKQDHKWSREQIARVVKRITLEQLGEVPYGEGQRFVEDLGLD